jgi:magnesium chelatase subunit I
VETVRRRVRVVELPVGATEDRVLGTLDLEGALTEGTRRFEPGILAAAHRGILYVDEVNLLDDHLVDVLLDAAAMGVNIVEREGISFSHPARFTLVGTMNPEEGELRPQLLDRFGLCVKVEGLTDPAARQDVVLRRLEFDADPDRFSEKWREAGEELAARIEAARGRLNRVELTDRALERAVNACLMLGVDGHRGDLTVIKTALTLATFEGRTRVEDQDVDRAAELALPHRVRRRPFQEVEFGVLEKLEKIKSEAV